MKKLIVAALLVASASVGAIEKSDVGPDCTQWTRNAASDRAWLRGYLSGLKAVYGSFVRSGSDPVAKLGSEQQAVSWIDRYCAANPSASVDRGAIQLFVELDQDRLQPYSR